MSNVASVANVVHSIGVLLALGCSPLGDLEAHARGDGARSTTDTAPTDDGPALSLGDGISTLPVLPIRSSEARGNEAEKKIPDGVVASPLLPPDEADAGIGPSPDPIASDAATPPEQSVGNVPPPAKAAATTSAAGPRVLVDAPALPDDLIDAPVAGEIVFSDEAVWEVEGVFEPTFEIHTPTASYWVVKPLGIMVSIEDGEPDAEQWIAFSSGFRPFRGVPSFPTPPATRVTTVRDDDSQTPTHLRLTSESADGLWEWVWDFYVTHATFTVNRAPLPFGFAYRGVPGGSLGPEDRLGSNDGGVQGARNSFNSDLAGPVEWAYLADVTLGRSLFAIQHRDDDLAERYQVRDNDTSLLSFGNGQLQFLPQRFSLGLIPSVNAMAIRERVEYIAGAIR